MQEILCALAATAIARFAILRRSGDYGALPGLQKDGAELDAVQAETIHPSQMPVTSCHLSLGRSAHENGLLLHSVHDVADLVGELVDGLIFGQKANGSGVLQIDVRRLPGW
jgi:hypothetical protein